MIKNILASILGVAMVMGGAVGFTVYPLLGIIALIGPFVLAMGLFGVAGMGPMAAEYDSDGEVLK